MKFRWVEIVEDSECEERYLGCEDVKEANEYLQMIDYTSKNGEDRDYLPFIVIENKDGIKTPFEIVSWELCPSIGEAMRCVNVYLREGVW